MGSPPAHRAPAAVLAPALLAALGLLLTACSDPTPDALVELPGDDDDTTDVPIDDDDTAPDDDDTAPDDDDTAPDDDDSTEDPVTDDDDDSALSDDDDSAVGPELSPVELCFEEFFDPTAAGPDYDQYAPTVGSHCDGTNHQDIADIERVVFLGDSVTVGTPPSWPGEFYRNILADALADRFWLNQPSFLWYQADWVNGTASEMNSGDFASCAKWGARADDLMRDNNQVLDCLPEEERDKTTLVIMTIGGNDIANLTQEGSGGLPTADLWLQVEQWIQDVEDAVAWLKTPGRFPNGVHVIFSNNFEFTDATGDVESCVFAGLGDFAGDQWEDSDAQELLVIWAMEQYMRIAVEYEMDMIFMLEAFCGHGFMREDPTGRCYRGPDAELWFDLTCIHPNPTGHQVIADMFLSVVDE